MKIVDLSLDVGGQWAAKLFAMDGAEVVRPATPGPPRPPALAAYLDAEKREVAWPGPALLDDADLVFTTFDGGRAVGHAAGVTIPEGCVEVTTSTFGTTGPYASFRGGPVAAWAAGGYLSITGKPEREPLIGPEYLCEYVAGYTAAIGAEAALRRRARGGGAVRVDVSAMEAMMPMHQTTFSTLAFGAPRQRMGRYYETYPLTVRPCRDGHLLICVVTDEEFDRFALAIDRPDLSADPRFATRLLRREHADALDHAMAPFLETHDGETLVGILDAHGVTAAQVARAEDVRANPQLRHRHFWREDMAPGDPLPRPRVFAAPSVSAEARASSRLARTGASDRPLAGIVVADFTVYWAGPSATRTLADLGARVIWIERPGSRARRGPAADFVATPPTLFDADLARNKESVVLDLNGAEGQAAARALIGQADIVVENNRPGVMEKLGLGAAAMCGADPRLVYVSLPGYGSDGPWAKRRSYGPAIEAASGIEGRTGYADDEPLRLGHALPDPVGGLAGALAALRGLRRRDATGLGGWYDVSQLEAYCAMCGEELLLDGPLPPVGNRSRFDAHIGVYPCAGDDAWIAVRLDGDADRARFAKVVGCAADDDADVRRATAGQERFALARALQAAGIEAFPALAPLDLPHDPHLRARGFFRDLRFGGLDAVLAGSPLGVLARANGYSPDFGEHSARVLAELAAIATA